MEPNIQVTISAANERKGLLGKFFPGKRFVRQTLEFEDLPEELRGPARDFRNYSFLAVTSGRTDHPSNEAMVEATRAGFNVIEGIRESYRVVPGERIEVATTILSGSRLGFTFRLGLDSYIEQNKTLVPAHTLSIGKNYTLVETKKTSGPYWPKREIFKTVK